MKQFIRRFLPALIFVLVSYQSTPAQVSPSCPAVHKSTSVWVPDPLIRKGIIDVPFKASIPDQLYDQFSVDDLARGIVERVRLSEVKHQDKFRLFHTEVDVMNDTDIILFFWGNRLSDIATEGFLNQHRTGHSRGMYSPSTRATAEDNFTGISIGSHPNSVDLRPKSAFLNIRSEKDLLQKSKDVPSQYGNIGAVLKSHVKERALWTYSDSLKLANSGFTENEIELLKRRGSFYRQTLSCESSICGNFYEVLIYGKISFDDVDYFLVSGDIRGESLKPYGKPIYRLNAVTRNRRVIYEKGALLFAGKAAEAAAPVRSEIKVEAKDVEIVPVRAEETRSSAKPENQFFEILSAAGFGSIEGTVQPVFLRREQFKSALIETADAKYLVYTPQDSDELFSEYATELQGSYSLLSRHEIPYRPISHITKSSFVQRLMKSDLELSKLSAAEKALVLPKLKLFLLGLIQQKIYLKGLRPSMFVLDRNGQLVLRGHEGLREMKSSGHAAERFDEKLLPHWERFFDEVSLKDLETFLQQLRTEYPKEKAS